MSELTAVAFEFERVTVVRAGRRVLDEITATIPATGITVISGPSGAGKTTLLRLCNRLEVPDAGTVGYRGQPLDALDPGLLGQEARSLSGGELQRMCLARTLVTQPETLLLDEPTSALDAQPKRTFETTARDLAAQGITIIWVTHDDAQADRVADRICQLRDGHLSGTPAEEAQP